MLKEHIKLNLHLMLNEHKIVNEHVQQTFLGLQDISWRRLQNVFSVTICCLGRRFEDVLKTSRKTSWRGLGRKKNRYAEDVLRIFLENILKTSWSHTKCLLGISVSKKSVFHKSISDESIANPKHINYNPIISIFMLFWNSSSISVLKIKISNGCSVLGNQLQSNSTLHNSLKRSFK